MSLPHVPRRGPEVPLWLIHPAGGAAAAPDAYAIVFDFPAFVEATHAGVPRLAVWSGCADVDPRGLRQTLRRVLAAEFDTARAQLTAWQAGEAPTGVSREGALAGLAVQGATAVLRLHPVGFVLGALVTLASLAGGEGRPPDAPAAESDRLRLESEIARLTAVADRAMGEMPVRLHRDLYAHAWAGHRGGRLTGMDYDAWPLPGYVRTHLTEDADDRRT